MSSTHLVINFLIIQNGKLTVGATDNSRWNWEIEDGHSGADAKTIVNYEIDPGGPRWTSSENLVLHCLPGDPIRPLVLQQISKLINVAWEIYNDDDLDQDSANDKYFGVPLLDGAKIAPNSETSP